MSRLYFLGTRKKLIGRYNFNFRLIFVLLSKEHTYIASLYWIPDFELNVIGTRFFRHVVSD